MRWIHISKLRDLSGAQWDEDNCSIMLEADQVVRVGIQSRFDFLPTVSSRRIPDSTRFLSQEFFHAEILYCSIEKVKILSTKISSRMVYSTISKKLKIHSCKFLNEKITYN
jgi:hypothetical protein